MEIGPAQYYYSPRHIARDFISTVAPFTLYACIFVATVPLARRRFLCSVRQLEPQLSWTLVAVVVAVFVFAAYVAGALANRLFLIPRHFSQRFSATFEYAQYYSANDESIRAWHGQFVPSWGLLAVDRSNELQQRVDQLVWFLERANPVAFLHVYREYAFLSMYRQSFIYSCTLGIVLATVHRWWFAGGMILGAVAVLIAIAANTREAVESEFNFIVSAGSWLLRQGDRDRDL